MAFQILGADKIIKLNDFGLLGQVQNVDYNPSLNTEDVFELGSTTRVAASQELETTGSFDFISIGGSAGLLARMILDFDTNGDFLGYLYHKVLASGTAVSGTTTTLTTSGLTTDELLGKVLHITAGSASGESRVITTNSTTVITVAPAFSVAIDNTSVFHVDGGPNGYTVTEAELVNSVFDLVMNEKSDQNNFNRSTVIPRVFLTTIAIRFDAGGNATETYSWSGDQTIVAEDPYHDVRCIPATKTTDTTATLADVAVASTTHALAYLLVDDRRITTDNTQDLYATLGAAGLITLTGTYTIPDNARLSAIVWDNTTPTSTWPQVVERQTPIFFLRGYQTNLYIAPTSNSAPTPDEQYLRVQSMDVNIDLRVEALRQIALNVSGTSKYCQVPTLPFRITANVSSYESDWRDWKAMLDPTVKPLAGSGADWYGDTLDFAPSSFKEDFSLLAWSYTPTGTLVQRWTFDDMKPESAGMRISAGGRAEVQWSFTGTAMMVEGINLTAV